MSTAPAAGPRGGVSQRAVAQVCRALARGVAAAASAPSSARLECSRLRAVKGTSKDLPVAAALPSLPLKQSSPAGFQRISAIEADGSAGGSVQSEAAEQLDFFCTSR